MQKLRHLPVDRGHDLIHGFNNGHSETSCVKILRHLKSYETSSDYGSALYTLVIHDFSDSVRIVDVPQRVDSI